MGKSLNYIESIKESEVDLEALLKKAKKSVVRDRLRYLLLLKTGKSRTQKEACEAINIGLRQGQRNWKLYKEKGLSGYIEIEVGGAPFKLSKAEEGELKERLEQDDIQFLHEAVAYVKEEYGKEYTLAGMHYVFKRLKIKKKTGRPTNIRQDKEGLKHFKKNIWS